MAEQGSKVQALEVLGDFLDSLSPSYQIRMARMNKYNERFKRKPWEFPKYVIANHPTRVINLNEEYPNTYFQFGYVRGYQYVLNDKGYPLIMCENGIFDNLEDALETVKYLKELRGEE